MTSISVRNWTCAPSRWLVWPVALCSLRPTVTWMCGATPLVGLVPGEGAAAEGFDVGQVDLGPHGCVRVVKLVAGADDLDLAEAGDEAGDVALAHPVLAAEVGQGGEEVVAVVEGDGEAAAEGEFVATHGRLPVRWRGRFVGWGGRTRRPGRTSRGCGPGRVRRRAGGAAGCGP